MIAMNTLESDVEIHQEGLTDKQRIESPVRSPQPGSLKGFRIAADFDDPLEDFKDYMG